MPSIVPELDRITVTVTVPTMMKFRVWLGVQLIKLGVRVTGMGVQVNNGIDA